MINLLKHLIILPIKPYSGLVLVVMSFSLGIFILFGGCSKNYYDSEKEAKEAKPFKKCLFIKTNIRRSSNEE